MDYLKLAETTGMVLVEVDGTGIKQPRMVTVKATGAQMQMPGGQAAFIWQGQKYPVAVEIEWDAERGPYKPGFYFIGGPLFAAGDYGRINFKGGRELVLVECDLVLDSVAVGAPKKAA